MEIGHWLSVLEDVNLKQKPSLSVRARVEVLTSIMKYIQSNSTELYFICQVIIFN